MRWRKCYAIPLLSLLATLTALVTLARTTGDYLSHSFEQPSDELPPSISHSSPPPLRIAIVESMGYHDEVTAALAYAFSQHPATAANLTLYLRAQRFGIGQVYDAFLRSTPAVIHPFDRISDLVERPTAGTNNGASASVAFDVLVMTSCVMDRFKNPEFVMRLFNSTRTHLFCVLHHTNALKVKSKTGGEDSAFHSFLPWIESKRITFLTLSSNLLSYVLTQLAPTWRIVTSVVPRVEAFVPVFPVALPDKNAIRRVMKTNATAFSMQGNLDPMRRSYDDILSLLQTVRAAKGKAKAKGRAKGAAQQKANRTDLTLHLLGTGTVLEIPKALASRVFTHRNLDYVPFYGVISESVALVPAFRLEEYYYERASSTVPASLIAGCPLVANRRLLSAYSYLDESVVWLQEEGETELDVVLRVAMERTEDERRAIKERVRMRAIELAAQNVRDLVRWAREAKADTDTAADVVRW